MAHGSEDDVIPLQAGIASRDFLTSLGYRVQWHEYKMPHSVCMEEIKAIGEWLQSVM
jgi:phospholipase/carboxylesterase